MCVRRTMPPKRTANASACKTVVQHPAQCECSYNRTSRPSAQFPEHCSPSALCAAPDAGSPRFGRRLLWHSRTGRAAIRHESERREQEQKEDLDRLLAQPPPRPDAHSSSAAEVGSATFLIAYAHNATRVRYWYSADPFRSYLNSMRLITRCVLSLRAVGARLPVHLLLAGERYAGFERALTAKLGVRILDADDGARHRIVVPRWASHFHKASFIKLAVLSLTQFDRVVLLDSDSVVLRNVDHLAAVPPPAFAFRFKCFRVADRNFPPIWEMNSGVMVLRPSEGEHARMQRLMNEPRGPGISVWWDAGNVTVRYEHFNKTANRQSIFVPSDPGDQSIWRSFYASVTELPIGYNAMKRSTFNNAAAAWEEVSILHDVDVSRGRMIPSPRVNSHYTNLTVYARLLVSAIAKELGVVDRG